MGILSRFTRRRLELDEEDFREEIHAHLAMAAQEQVDEGVEPAEARYAALREFGNVTRTTEAARRVWMPPWLEAIRDQFSDGRYAVRTLAKNPGFSLTVICVLALGIGLNAAVFTMLKAMVLTPLAGVEGSAQLVAIHGETSTGRATQVSYPAYKYIRQHDRAFAGLFGSIVARVNIGRGRGARQVWGELVTGNYFDVLGLRAVQGRTLMPADETAPGRDPVAVISDGFWRRDLNADPAVIGRTIEVNNQLLTVVGVADPRFHGTTVVYDVDVYVPVTMAPQMGFTFGSRDSTPSGVLSDPLAAVFYPQGYLREGTGMEDARAQTEALWSALLRDRQSADTTERIRLVPFWQMPGGAPMYVLPTLVVLSAMGLLVLMIACANIAGLVIVRGVSRRGELAVRQALGASRGRIVRLLIIENLVLALPGAVCGVLLAKYGIPPLVGYAEALAAPNRIFFNVEVDYLVIGFAAAVACGCALVFGFLPALRSSRIDLVSVINEDASPRGATRSRIRGGLVIAQVAVSLLLLIGAGLVTRSLDAARRADTGFDGSRVVSVGIDVKQNGYDRTRGRQFYRKLLETLRADPGVDSVTFAFYTPMQMTDTRADRMTIEGYLPAAGEDLAFSSNVVGPDYFRTLSIPLVAGRGFEDRDDESAEPAVVVNRTLADRYLGGARHAPGRRVRIAGREWRTVIGVAADIKYARINEPPRPYFYLPVLQAYRSGMILQARARGGATSAEVEELAARSAAHVAALDADLPVLYARPMAGQLRGALIFFSLAASMLFVFGTAGMALAAIGTYGLVSYAVKQSTHEIGIRMALGASGASVVRKFVWRGVTLGAAGAAIGILGALGATRLLGSVLFGVSALDVLSFARALLIVGGGVLLATLVPAWRAARTNPVNTLRHQ